MNAKTFMSYSGGAVHHRGADGATTAGQCSCTSLISRAFPHLWPRGAEISFCHTIDHCRTILYYTVLFQDLAHRRRYCRLFTLLLSPAASPGSRSWHWASGKGEGKPGKANLEILRPRPSTGAAGELGREK